MKKEIIIIFISYIIASLIRGLILFSTGFSFNIFQDEFNLTSFVLDVMIWVFSYIGVRLIITKFTK
jgi:hypothetical protein